MDKGGTYDKITPEMIQAFADDLCKDTEVKLEEIRKKAIEDKVPDVLKENKLVKKFNLYK